MFNFNGKTPKEIIFNGKSLSKLLFNGIEVWRKSLLPDGYVLCDYLESTGTQYIDTGYIPTINTDIKTRASIQYNAGSMPVALFGYLSGNDPYNRYAVQYHKDFIYCAKGNIEAINDTIDYTKMCDIETQGDKYIYNGIKMSVAPLDFSVSNNLSIILFARQTTNVNRHSKSKIEFFKIYENGVLVQYLIPCLDNNRTPCMYDTVSGKTFYNKGTGTFKFKIKVQIPDGYTLCDYLESTGTQYIDTGIIYDTNNTYTISGKINYSRKITFSGSGWNAGGCFGINQDGSISDGANLNGVSGANKDITFTQTINSGSSSQTVTSYSVNGNEYSLKRAHSSLSTYAGNGGFGLFAVYSTNTYTYFASGKIYYYIIWDNGTIARYLVPCLDNNRTPCMYDVVSKQTFYNQGTGEFKWSINATYLQLKDFVDGFVNSSTGVVAPNSTYPRAISSPLVLFEKGKTYKVTSNLSATKTDDGVRFRIYGTDDTYKQSIGASQITTNAYATFEALDDAGKANFYVAKDVLITPKQDFKTRIMYIDKNYISEFKIEEI